MNIFTASPFKYSRHLCYFQSSHARQLSDTSSINMFLDDEAFRNIVLGDNYFRLIGEDDKFRAPHVCGAEVNKGYSCFVKSNCRKAKYPRIEKVIFQLKLTMTLSIHNNYI